MDDNIEKEEIKDEVFESMPSTTRPPKLSRMRSPSFEGYFASKSGAIELQTGNTLLKSSPDKLGEIQKHLDHMVSILREIDALRMAVRIESKIPLKKRYLTVVSSEQDHSAVIGIDWCQGQGPTIGLVLPIHSTTVCKLDGDGGFHVSRTSTMNHSFRPVSVQTLWSARHVIEKAIQYAEKHRYYEGVNTNGFLDYYLEMVKSNIQSITEWNELDDCDSFIMDKVNLPPDPDPERERIKTLIKQKLKEIMRHLDMNEVTIGMVRNMCQEALGFSLADYKLYAADQILVVMGQMDSASEILDYLYLGSEWNASDLEGLKKLGIGYILNLTREVDNFFPHTMVYYTIRVMDYESTELLKHWDHTYRFIERAREAGSKILVHCRYGISRSASTVIAYLMKKKGWNMASTLDFVVKRRDIVQPNPGFTNQLIIYQGILNSSRNRFSSLFHPASRTNQQVQEENQDSGLTTATEKRQAFRKLHEITDIAKDDTDGVETCTDEEKSEALHSGERSETTDETSTSTEDKDLLDESLVTHCNDSIYQSIETDQGSESSTSKILEISGSQKKLRRAITMSSAGAVFIDNENENETSSLHSSNETDQTPVKELKDESEDAVMQQVVMATIRKNELVMSVKKLNDENENEANDICNEDLDQFESNLKPSMLRRLSHASQVLHFENIASMKKRRSRTDSDVQKESGIMECDPEMESTTKVMSQTNVTLLSEVFTRRSKKHIRDYARRRTLDDHAFCFDENLGEVKMEIMMKNETVSTISEVPEESKKLELASRTDKVLPKAKPQFPQYRLYGRLVESKSFDDGYVRCVGERSDAFFTSADALNLEINKMNGEEDNTEAVIDEKEDVSVADLVHLHDKIIREKSIVNRTSEIRHFSDGSMEDEKKSTRFLHRAQSFPKMKRFEILKKDDDVISANNRQLNVKSIAVSYETKEEKDNGVTLKNSELKNRSSSLEVNSNRRGIDVIASTKMRASTDVDLRSVDETS